MVVEESSIPAATCEEIALYAVDTNATVDEAQKLIDKQFEDIIGKKFNFRPAGYYIAVKIYVRPDELSEIIDKDGKKQTLWTAPIIQKQDAQESCSALVVAVGPGCFKDRDTGVPWADGPTCRVGDWVAIPRASTWLTNYCGVPVGVLSDDKIIGTLDDPSDLSSVYVPPKI